MTLLISVACCSFFKKWVRRSTTTSKFFLIFNKHQEMSDPHPHPSFRALPCFANVCNQQELQSPQVSFSHSPWTVWTVPPSGCRESFTTCNDLTGAKFRRSFLVSKLSAKKTVGPLGKFAQRKHPDRVLKDAFVYLTGKNNCHREKMLGG